MAVKALRQMRDMHEKKFRMAMRNYDHFDTLIKLLTKYLVSELDKGDKRYVV